MESLVYECAECGLKIVSLYEKQFNYNVEQHELKHKREQEREKTV